MTSGSTWPWLGLAGSYSCQSVDEMQGQHEKSNSLIASEIHPSTPVDQSPHSDVGITVGKKQLRGSMDFPMDKSTMPSNKPDVDVPNRPQSGILPPVGLDGAEIGISTVHALCCLADSRFDS